MIFPIRLYYIFTTKVIVLIKSNNMPLKAPVTTPLKAPAIILSIAATTLGTSGDTSIVDTDLQLIMVG